MKTIKFILGWITCGVTGEIIAESVFEKWITYGLGIAIFAAIFSWAWITLELTRGSFSSWCKVKPHAVIP